MENSGKPARDGETLSDEQYDLRLREIAKITEETCHCRDGHPAVSRPSVLWLIGEIRAVRADLADAIRGRDDYFDELSRVSEALGEGPYSSASEHVAALRAQLPEASDALKDSGKELTEVRESHRAFKLAILAALGVSDPWAITTWRQAEICAAIERLCAARAASGKDASR